MGETAPLPKHIARHPAWASLGRKGQLRLRGVLADGRCSVASVLVALDKIGAMHNTEKCKSKIDAERRKIGRSIQHKWSEQRWVDSIPWQFRQMAVSNNTTATSYQVMRDTMVDQYTHDPRKPLPACFLWAASEMYGVGIFLIVDGFPSPSDSEGVHRRAEYYHIGGDHGYTEHIVIYSSVTHYQACEWDFVGVSEKRCTPGSDVYETLSTLCDEHAHGLEKEGFDLGEDTDKMAMQAAALKSAAPRVDDDRRLTRSRTHKVSERAAQPQLVPDAIPHDKQRRADTSKSPQTKVRSVTTRAKVKPADGLSQSKAAARTASSQKRQPSPHTRRPTSYQSQLPLGQHPTVAQLAAHGNLYEFIAFSNVPQWVGMCCAVFNAYRVASQNGDSQRQLQAIIDLLMLPQKVLTKLARAGVTGRERLVRVVKARCRDVGQQLRRRYDCTDPADRNVQLTVETGTLVHSTNRTRERQELGDTDVVLSDDESAERAPSRIASVHSDDTTVGVDPSLASTDSEASSSSDDEDDYIEGDNSAGSGPIARAFRMEAGSQHDSEEQAVLRAQHLINTGHTKRASQTLHSTSTMADLTQLSVREAMQRLHPPLPAGSVLPVLPADAHQIILEDDDEMMRIIRSSDNGSASGPSGWGGNMLSSLAESSICRGGIIALLKDITNGNIPDEARQYLLASRLVGLNKPDAGVRPIAVGELFYRLAGVIAVRKVTAAAAELLSPHQYGIGVSGGAERIVHSMQYSLLDKTVKRAVLKVDISNAFNSCDRAAMLQKLYATPQLAPLYRIADFGYSAPSQLLLQRCDGLSIQSCNGVRQGDPLACLLFCLYMRDVYEAVANQADVTLYAFVDDLHIVGKPVEVMKALTALQTLLPAVSLKCNTAKSHFAYFHRDTAPLNASVLQTLSQHDISIHDDWLEVVGAVIGRDSQAVQAGGGCDHIRLRRRRFLPSSAVSSTVGAERHAGATTMCSAEDELPAALHTAHHPALRTWLMNSTAPVLRSAYDKLLLQERRAHREHDPSAEHATA